MPYTPAYRELVDYLVTPYFEATVSGEIVLVNKALQGLVGDVSGRRIWELFDRQFEPSIQEMFENVMAAGQQQVIELSLAEENDSTNEVLLELAVVESADLHESICLRGKVKSLEDDEFFETKLVLKRQTEELGFLNNLSEVTSSSLDLDDILYSICRESQRIFEARNVGIALLNEKKDVLKVVSFFSDQPGESDITGLEFSLQGNDASLFVIKTGEPIVIPDAQANPITRSLHSVMKLRRTTSLMVIPLLARGEVIGTIGMPSSSENTFSQQDVLLGMTIAAQVASVVDNAQLHRSVKRARDVAERELEIGHQIQASFFPASIPEIPGWKIMAYSELARQVGGDFYDAFPLGDGSRIGIVLADVCDKGVGAALFMVLFRSMLRAHIIEGFDQSGEIAVDIGRLLSKAVGKTNNYIANNHAQANMFATVFAAVLEKDSDGLWYLNCGHDAPILMRSTGESKRLTPTSAAIGMFPNIRLSSSHLEMTGGDCVIAFTDGVTDACSVDGDSFGDDTVVQVLKSDDSLDNRLAALKAAVYKHIGGAEQYDDITWIGFERA